MVSHDCKSFFVTLLPQINSEHALLLYASAHTLSFWNRKFHLFVAHIFQVIRLLKMLP